MIEIKIQIEEKPDGSVIVSTKACSVGTTKEMIHALVSIHAVETSCKILMEKLGGEQKMIHEFRKVAPVGDG